ncbi:type A2 lantipeptide [Sediminibacillus dalangtanensis]|uniref:Lantibiotic n=1 Tax=Sediminibacillus dalangtanensis TaxID=2729421 RepID=A0ABX7VVU9_9BACI|nr:lacticin 481 family lantibiotic [Sediminibacillus dalangtanensis]QTM98472.1 type A2 lantipeptide [Sediminibacillus dalangtanensis]
MKENKALEAIQDISDEELADIVGADGAISTVSHECHMNTWQFIFTCCF